MFGSSNNIHLDKLKVNTTFNLFKKSWKIIEIGEYDWRMDNKSIEYKIQSADKTAYLEVEFHKGAYEVVYTEKISLDQDHMSDGVSSKEIFYEGKPYFLEENYQGDYKNITTFSNRESLESFLFYANDDELLTIEKWNDGTYEAYLGEELKPKKIKDIKLG